VPQTASGPRPSDRWIPWAIVAFFVVLVSTLVPMCVIAIRTNPGVVTNNAYEKGLAYNKLIQDGEQQAALNWRGDLTVTELPGGKIHADFLLTGADGKPLENAEVKLWLVRPAQAGNDRNASMTLVSGGHYGADIALPERGLWEARVSATCDGHNFQTVRRVTLP